MKKLPQAEEPFKQNHFPRFLYFSKWQNMVDERNEDRSPRSFARVVARRRRQLLIVVLFLLTVLLLLLVGTSALETFFGRSSPPLETRGDEARAEKGDFSAYLPSRLYKTFFRRHSNEISDIQKFGLRPPDRLLRLFLTKIIDANYPETCAK